jgi:sodium/proline symporter
VAEDIYCGVLGRKNEDKKILRLSRITVLVIACLAYLIALNPDSSIMGLVSNAWAGLGAAFGPVVVFSLFWKRTNLQGAVAGVATGALTVLVWDYLPLVNGSTLGTATGLYSLAVGFVLSAVMIVAVSLLTPEPSAEILQEFEDVRGK